MLIITIIFIISSSSTSVTYAILMIIMHIPKIIMQYRVLPSGKTWCVLGSAFL